MEGVGRVQMTIKFFIEMKLNFLSCQRYLNINLFSRGENLQERILENTVMQFSNKKIIASSQVLHFLGAEMTKETMHGNTAVLAIQTAFGD